MSPKIPSLAFGLVLIGAPWGGSSRAAQEPAAPADAVPLRPAAAPTVHLLSNDKVLRGSLTEVDSQYVLETAVGTIRIPKSKLIHSFHSLREVYEYKRGQFPAEDTDEHMKLARWCLTEKLMDEFKAELTTVLAITPDHSQARAMLENLKAMEARAHHPRTDPEVVRTGGEVSVPNDAPALRDAALAHRAIKALGVRDVPVIFDLPAPLALKRTQEFARYVHPELQKHCAGCHNERNPSPFQLMQVRGHREVNGDVIRVNLDATLQLVDPANPRRSPLLVNAVMPHGPQNRPILSGPNHPTYRVLAAWIDSLRAPAEKEAMASTARGASIPAPLPAGGFASDRAPAPPAEPLVPTTPTPPAELTAPPNALVPENVVPPGQLVPGSYEGPVPNPPANAKFLTNQERIQTYARQVQSRRGAAPASNPGPGPLDPREMPPLPPPPTGKDDDRPSPPAKPATKPKKKTSISPEALEQFLRNRNEKR